MSETNTCAGPQCDRDVRAKGLCGSHYRQLNQGRPLAVLRPRRKPGMSTEEIGQWLIEQVEVDPDSGCWVWTRGLDQNGYGIFRFQGKKRFVHRLMLSIFVEPLVDGFLVDHINCISRACCNPAHLRQVSPAGNQQNRRSISTANTSGHVGVTRDKKSGKWRAHIQVGGKLLSLGRFTDLDDAIAARKAAEQKYHPYRDPEYREPVAS